MTRIIFIWFLRVLAAVILLQTLYFKFTAILILMPRTTLLGALMGLGLMSGAIFFHLTKLGINFGGDAILFAYAVITFTCCLILIIIHRKNIPQLLKLKF